MIVVLRGVAVNAARFMFGDSIRFGGVGTRAKGFEIFPTKVFRAGGTNFCQNLKRKLVLGL